MGNIIIGVLIFAGVIAGIGFLIARHTRKCRLKFLDELNEDQEYDLVELWKYRVVLPKGTGQTITDIKAEIQNSTDKRLKVVIAPGTYFVSTGSHQNMVTRSDHRFTLPPQDTKRINVPASCINAELPIPSEEDMFHGVAKVSDQLVRFLENARGEDAMVVQAGVWALTDGYSGYQIQNKLVAQTPSGHRHSAVFADGQ